MRSKSGSILQGWQRRFILSRSQSSRKQIPPGLLLLVIYKAGTAVALTLVCVALSLTWIHHAHLSQYVLPSHRVVVVWVLNQLVQIPVHTLRFAATAAGFYALISALEAIGLWCRQPWARWLVLFGVGFSLPVEIFELVRSPSLFKTMLLGVNGFMFWYVLTRFPKHE